jgi:hypothetical protein
MITRRLRELRALRDDTSGVALLEFAFILPVFLVMSLTGAELTNYVVTRMRVSQMALHLADNAARIGSGSQLQAKTISEGDIDDLLTGTGLQAGELDLYKRGRVVISGVEPIANPNTTNRYKIAWQRCRGLKNAAKYRSAYNQGQTNIAGGVGPAGQLITAPDGGATMYVEVFYEYSSLAGKAVLSTIGGGMADAQGEIIIPERASIMVRDRRDLSQIYPTTGVTPSTCNRYTVD